MAQVMAYWRVFLNGLLVTLELSVLSIVLGTIVAIIVSVLLLKKNKIVKKIIYFFIKLFRGLPPLLLLFLGYYGAAYLGYDISVNAATITIFTFYAGAYLTEILRSGIEAIPPGQMEAADCIGLSFFDKVRYIILPQAIKASRTAMVGFYIGLIKDTSIASIIGYVELIRQSKTIINATAKPFQVYLITACIYFIICFPLSKFNASLEKKGGAVS